MFSNYVIQSKIILPHCAVQCGHEHQRGRKLHAFQPSPKEVNRMHIITQLSNADNVTHGSKIKKLHISIWN